MEHPLDGCIAKVERAGEHWEALSNAVTTYFDRPEDGILAYVTEGEYARETEEYIFRARLQRPLPIQWGILVGDYAHNLRSALDHLMWELVKLREEQKPTARTQFPIFLKEHGKKSFNGPQAKEMMKGISANDRQLIRDLQPFATAPKGHPPRDTELAVLAWLSNTDKHRIVHPTASTVFSLPKAFPALQINPPELYFGRSNDAGRITSVELLEPLLSEDFQEIARLKLEPEGPNPQITLMGLEPGIFFTKRLAAFLDLMLIAGSVREVIERFRPEFDA